MTIPASGSTTRTALYLKNATATGQGTNAIDLQVDGDIHVSGKINSKFQDVAEWVDASGEPAAGTVVVLDPRRENAVIRSARSYDTTVAGVVSADPGIVLGQSAPGKAQIATTGRVRVRVDATKHPIAIGDLLVTGEKPGTAMVSEPIEIGGRRLHQPGTVLGKALQRLESGEGQILVLLSLQ